MDVLITLVPLLPAVIATVAIRRGSRWAVLSFVILGLQLSWWLAYTLTDRISNPGMSGAWMVFIWPTIASLAIAISGMSGRFGDEDLGIRTD